MPVWADPRRGEQVRLLADDDMTLLATFVAPPGPRPMAADFRMLDETNPDRMARIAARDLPGVRVITRPAEAAALEAAGGTVLHRGVHMIRDLVTEPPPPQWAAPHLPPGLHIGPLEVEFSSYADAQALGFPPGHPDHDSVVEARVEGALEALLSGQTMGPLYEDASSAVRNDDGDLVAALVVVMWPSIGEEWRGGPWAVDLFRLRSLRTTWPIGRHLLARAVTVAALDGHARMGLSVNVDNPARRLYRRLGFEDAFERVSLDLPGRWPARP